MQSEIWPEDPTYNLPIKYCQSSRYTLSRPKKNQVMSIQSNQA